MTSASRLLAPAGQRAHRALTSQDLCPERCHDSHYFGANGQHLSDVTRCRKLAGKLL
jgi:hypothetical protein